MAKLNQVNNQRGPRSSTMRFLFCAIAAMMISGCGQVGGSSFSLLPSSQILDPLEVPPGLSPLLQTNQISAPEVPDSNPDAIQSASVQRLRNLESWDRFQRFQEFKNMEAGVGLDAQEFREAKLKGKGIFQVTTYETIEGDVRLRIVDSNAESVWNRLLVVLNDMGVRVTDTDEEKGTIEVANVRVGTKPTLAQRVGINEYSGTVERLYLSPISDEVLEVRPTTSLNVDVDYDSGLTFLTRLRFYLLTHYLNDPEGKENVADMMLAKKNMVEDEDGNLVIHVFAGFDETWSQIGNSLEASGVEIEDWDRSTGTYIVSFVSIKQQERRRFWRRQKENVVGDREKFLVTVKEEDDRTSVTISVVEDASAEKAQTLANTLFDRIA